MVDTPGQIEIFTWSASGAIITEAFASCAPTMVAYILDTPRCQQPQTFMSNMLQASLWATSRASPAQTVASGFGHEAGMAEEISMTLQACSIMFKSRLPLLLVFNKADAADPEVPCSWMASFEAFHQALDKDSTYAASLSRSLSLVCPTCAPPQLAHVLCPCTASE